MNKYSVLSLYTNVTTDCEVSLTKTKIPWTVLSISILTTQLRTCFEDQYFRRNNFICRLAVRMKLFLHNILTSRVLKSVKVGYPLKLKANALKVSTVDYDPASVARLIPKVEWSVVKSVADEIGEEYIPCLPEEVPANYSENEEFLKLAHRALLEVDVMEGVLVCPETGREFTISNGIPNMLVNEGE